MNRTAAYSLISSALLCGVVALALSQDEVSKRRNELQNLRGQIMELEVKIKEQQRREQGTLEDLDNYDRKATLVRKLIGKLRLHEKDLQQTIDRSRSQLEILESQLKFLKEHYAGYVSSVYKTGRAHDLELILSSNSINQFYVRTLYLQRFSEQRRRDAAKIIAKKSEIEETQAGLQVQLEEERRLIAEKGAEEDRLTSLASDRKKVLTQIQKDKRTIQREIERRRKAAKELENIIAALIESERIRKERESAEIREGKLPQPPPITENFEMKRGRLRWPVSEGVVVAKFGNQVHPRLKTITQNTGIDIAVRPGSTVTTVADGEVATILWYPSYGNLLIMNHYNGYRTVYTHLAEILVAEGQRVKEGDIIGTSGEALDGPRLHFELWKDREKQNPELWLSRQ